jgi:hypothetical protein
VRGELSKKETWECIAAKTREHGLPRRRLLKEGSVDTDFGRLADALLIRAERAIAKLEFNDLQRTTLSASCVPGCETWSLSPIDARRPRSHDASVHANGWVLTLPLTTGKVLTPAPSRASLSA